MEFLDFREPVSAWSHCAGLMLALPGTLLLWRRSAGDRGKRLAVLVYGLSLAFCYSASTLYPWRPSCPAARIAAFARLDGVGIFALIAGTLYPAGVVPDARPMAAMDPGGRLGRGDDGHDLDCGWPPASHLCWRPVFTWGWGGVPSSAIAEIAQVVTHRALVPILVGGLSYSVGAVLNLLHWPALWPGVFGAHELFHLFVLAGSLAHYLFILKVVVPFVHGPPELSM